MKEEICDLHVHSTYSDGNLTPTQLAERAKDVGVSAVALCDHNTIGGATEFLSATKERGIEGIAGVEFSTDYEEVELHILGLHIPKIYYDQVENWAAGMRRRKEESNLLLVENLRAGGYDISFEEVQARGEHVLNRAHIALVLQEKGYVSSVKEAFATLLSPNGGFYIQPRRLNVFDTIAFIKTLGGVAVWAHPLLNLPADRARKFASLAIPYGLDGMETQYARYDEATTKIAKTIAYECGILESGGSDFHGIAKPDIEIGIGRGDLRVPLSVWENLKAKGQVCDE